MFKSSHCLQWLFFILLAGVALAGCGRQQAPTQLSGSTMGTTWHLTYQGSEQVTQAEVQAVLERVEQSMSTWRDDSEISRFNRAAVAAWQPVSADFLAVMQAAHAVWSASAGAFDVTVAPAVNLWGFGPGERRDEPPSTQQVETVLEQVGTAAIEIDASGSRLRKSAPRQLDFSSLAKGYAVDAVAQLLLDRGVNDFLVEVGGEMRLAGLSPRGDAWRVAIEQPQAGTRAVATAIALSDVAVATSGDYRNFFEYGGRRYSHSIDPRTGWPVSHELVSVTVVASSAMMADAWATTLTVLGADEALAVAEEHALAVYFIQRAGGEFRARHTAAFAPYLAAAEEGES